MGKTQINIVVNQDSVSSVLDFDKEIRAAMRQADTENRQEKKEIEETTSKNTAQTTGTGTGIQDPATNFKKYRKQDLTAARTKQDVEPKSSWFGKMITRIAPVSTENDNLGYSGWFGTRFEVNSGRDFYLQFIGVWDREGNGASRTHYMGLLGGPDNIFYEWTLPASRFAYSEGGYIYAKLENPIRLYGGSSYGIAAYYFENDYADRYEYYVTSGDSQVGEGNSEIFSGVEVSENGNDFIFPFEFSAGGGGGYFYLPALNINIASVGYF